MKKLLLCALLALSTINGVKEKIFYNNMAEELNFIRVIDSEYLTQEILETRNGNIIIEKTIGRCLDEKGNGKIINAKDNKYNYISYKCVEGVKVNDVILTYFIYNPDSNGVDDILERFDYIIDSE